MEEEIKLETAAGSVPESSINHKRSLNGPESKTKRQANGVAVGNSEHSDEGAVYNNDRGVEHEEKSEQGAEISKKESEEVAVSGAGSEEEVSEEEEEEEEEDEQEPGRLEAVEALTSIEIEFASLRDQIHNDQLARFDLELSLCSQGIHPELMVIEHRIRERHDFRAKRNRSTLDYQLQCISNTTRAMRGHLHQQFLKDCNDTKTELLRRTTREWYQVNDERRAADKLVPEYALRPDPDPSGGEISLLVAISKHHGFPAAPKIMGVNDGELRSDLNDMGLHL